MKFIVMYCMPSQGMEEWMKIPAEQRQAEEDRLKAKWDTWLAEHRGLLVGGTAGVGKTKRVTASGVADARNDMMLYSIAEGESHDAVAAAFAGHPHLEIPGAWIDVCPANELPGMPQ